MFNLERLLHTNKHATEDWQRHTQVYHWAPSSLLSRQVVNHPAWIASAFCFWILQNGFVASYRFHFSYAAAKFYTLDIMNLIHCAHIAHSFILNSVHVRTEYKISTWFNILIFVIFSVLKFDTNTRISLLC